MLRQIHLSPTTKELIIFLVDSEFARNNYQIANQEIVVMACILFVIKMQGDFSSDIKDLVHFIHHKLGLEMSSVWKYERTLLSNSPEYIATLPGIKDLMRATLTLMEINPVSRVDLLELWHSVMENYIVDFASICSLQSMIVQSVVHACCPESLLVFKLRSLQLEEQSRQLESTQNSSYSTPRCRSPPQSPANSPSFKKDR